MSYAFDEETSLDTVKEYLETSEAALDALDETRPLAVPFRTLLDEVKAAMAVRDNTRHTARKADARTRVHDAQWDAALKNLSGHAFLAAGKKNDAEPYLSLFGAVTADDATTFGPHRATVVGGNVLEKAAKLADPRLATQVAAFSTAQNNLKASAAAALAADEKVQALAVDRRVHVRKTAELVAHTEVGILQRFPGRRDLVRAMLAPERAATRKRAAKADPAAAQNGSSEEPGVG